MFEIYKSVYMRIFEFIFPLSPAMIEKHSYVQKKIEKAFRFLVIPEKFGAPIFTYNVFRKLDYILGGLALALH